MNTRDSKFRTCMGRFLEETCSLRLFLLYWTAAVVDLVRLYTLNLVCVYTHIDIKKYVPLRVLQYFQQRSTGSYQQQIYWLLCNCRLVLLQYWYCCTMVQLQYGSSAVLNLVACSVTVVLRLYYGYGGKQEIGSRSCTGYEYSITVYQYPSVGGEHSVS